MPFTAWKESWKRTTGRFNALLQTLSKKMSSRSYAEINLHLTWHTKDNYPFVTNRLKPDLYAFIKNRVVEDRQAYFHAVGGIADHVHLAASFFPPFEIDNWIGQIKGASSHEFGKALQWQSGYGVVSFGTRDLIWVVSYIHDQEERHRTGRISDRLERHSGDWKGR